MKNERKRLILFWFSFYSLFGAWKIVGINAWKIVGINALMPTIFQALNKM